MTKEQDKAHDQHDRGYKLLFSFYKLFQQLIEGYVEGDWRNKLDYAKSQQVNKTFIMKGFKKRESDVLYKVPLLEKDKEIYLYVLIEHQSSVDYLIAFRILVYLVEIWKEHYNNSDKRQRKRKSYRLPPVFPIVLYNGKKKWTASRTVKELIEVAEEFEGFIPEVKYHLIDIPRLPLEKLNAIGNSLAGVFELEQEIAKEGMEQLLKEALGYIFKEEDEEVGTAILEWVLNRMKGQLKEETIKKVIAEAEAKGNTKKEKQIMLETIPTKLVELGKEQGKIELLKEMLEKRYGKLSVKLDKKVSSIRSEQEIKQVLDLLLSEKTLQSFEKKWLLLQK